MPTDPQTHNDMKGAFQHEFGATDDEYDAAMETGTVTMWPMNFASKWGFIVGMPVSVIIEDGPSDDRKKVTFMLQDAYAMNPNKFYRSYRKGEVPYYYRGPVQDKIEYMTQSEIEKHQAKPFEGNPGAPGAPGLGTAGGMGGGMPPAPMGAEGMPGGTLTGSPMGGAV